MADPVATRPTPDSLPTPPLWRRPRFWLIVMVVGFYAISLYAGVASYADLQTQNSTDAGIFTQAVASATFGHAPPFYESYDCVVKARCSFLIVHPGFVLYAALPVYALFPSTVTLMALRAALVAGAAIPLYWLTRQVTKSPWKGLLAAGLFLVWAPSFVGDAFSVHLESLLPIELFSLAALWVAGRYRLALGVAAVTFLTFEVFPLFTFVVGVFFLFPYIQRAVRSEWDRWRAPDPENRPSALFLSRGWRWTRETLRVREVRYCLVLMAASAVAYVILVLFMNIWGHQLLGVAAPPLPPGIRGIFWNNSSPPGQYPLTILTTPQTITNAEYWLLLLALVGFIPLLVPRTLILYLPWMGWTFISDSYRFTTLGHQYSLIAAAPIFIGLAYGLTRVPLFEPPSTAPSAEESPSPGTPSRRPWSPGRSSQSVAWAGVLIVVIGANLLLAPINPILPSLGLVPGEPFEPNYFDHSLAISPSFVPLERLVGSIPSGAFVGASAAIFPLVANDPHAYVLLGAAHANLTHLPFDTVGAPQYVLLTPAALGMLGPSLEKNVSNATDWGLRAYVGSTVLGPALLYEKAYSGTAQLYGPPLPPINATYGPGTGLVAGPRGVVGSNASSPSGRVIESLDEVDRAGLVWKGPDVFFTPGEYVAEVHVAMSGQNLSMHPGAGVLRVQVSDFGGLAANESYPASDFQSGEWTDLTFNFTLSGPVPDVNVNGYLESDELSATVAWVSVVAGSP
jgi:uncharacterized membrane protein